MITKTKIHAMGVKTYTNKTTGASYVKKRDVNKILASADFESFLHETQGTIQSLIEKAGKVEAPSELKNKFDKLIMELDSTQADFGTMALDYTDENPGS